MNFGIEIDGVMLDVGDSSLTIEWVSSFFNENTLFAGSYSYPIQLPATDKNKSVLGNSHLLENRHARKRIEVNIQLFAQSWKRGTLVYDVSDDGWAAHVTIDVGVVAEWMRERTLANSFTITNNGRFVKFVELAGRGSQSGNRSWIQESQLAAPGAMPFVCAPYRNDMATGEVIADNSASYKEWLVNPTVSSGNQWDDTVWSPLFYLVWVIREVCDFLGFTAVGSFLEDDEIKRWVIYNTGIFHSTELGKSDFAIAPARHLPDITISNFFKLLRNDFRVCIYFESNTRRAYFVKADDLLQTDDTIDLSGTLRQGSMRIKDNPVSGYELVTHVDSGDEMPSIFPYVKSYSIGVSDTPKNTPLSAAVTIMYAGAVSANYHIRCPWVRQQPNLYGDHFVGQPGHNPDKTYGKNGFDFRLFAYRGREGNRGGSLVHLHPYLTVDALDTNGNDAYDMSVSPGGEKGFLNKLCLNWYNMLCTTEEIDFRSVIPVKRFFDIDPMKKVIISTSSLAKTALLLNRVTFDPGLRSDEAVVDARILAYPLFNIAGLSAQADVVFEDGEVVVPEIKVYARLEYDDFGYWTENAKRNKTRRTDVYVAFYRDPAGTVPYSVDNLNVYYQVKEEERYGMKYKTTTRGPFRVSGERAFLRTEPVYNWRKKTVWNLWSGYDYHWSFALLERDNTYILL